jgi:pentatricopeptide repeat-containing protein PET309
MLERTAGCLDTGSLRCLLPSSKHAVKGRRALHSTFWNHAAGDSELPALWAALVHGRDGQHEEVVEQSNTGGKGGLFLDFLYPAGTLNFIRSRSSWASDKHHPRWKSSRFAKFSQRLYTSSTAMALSTVQTDSEVVAEEDDSRPTLEAGNKGIIYEKLGLLEDNEYGKAWEQYCLLNKHAQMEVHHELMSYLSTSERTIDASRIVELFKSKVKGNTAETFRCAIRANIILRNLDEASRLSMKAYDGLGIVEFDLTFRQLMIAGLWIQACSLWHFFRSRLLKRGYKSGDFVLKFPDFEKTTCELIDYTNKRAERKSPSSEISQTVLQEFTTIMGRKVFVDGRDLNEKRLKTVLAYLSKFGFGQPEEVEMQIDSLVASKRLPQYKIVVKIYRKLRDDDFVFTSRTLDKVIGTFILDHNARGMQEVLDDFCRYYGKPSRRAYHLAMKEYAYRRDTDTVMQLYQQYNETYPKRTSDPFNIGDTFAPILQVHSKRGELSEVIRCFEEISVKHKIRPTVLCWNILIAAYGRALDGSGAFRCFRQMVNTKDVEPNAWTYLTLMGVAASRGDLAGVQDMYRFAESAGVEKDTVMVDCLVKAHIDNNDLEAAESICLEALEIPMKGSRTRMWNYLIVAYALRRELNNANKVLRLMTQSGVAHDELTYAAIMQALAMVKLPDQATKIMKYALPQAGFRPKSVHYAILMGAYLYTGQIPRVLRMHMYLLRRRIDETASTNAMLLRALMNRDAYMLANGTATQKYESAMNMFLGMVFDKRDNSDIEKGMYQIPLEHKYAVSINSYVIKMLARADEVGSAMDVYQRFIGTSSSYLQRNIPTQILAPLLYAKYRERDRFGVQECWDLILNSTRDFMKPIPIAQLLTGRHDPPAEPPSKILYKYQLVFEKGLSYYLAHLNWDSRYDEMILTVKNLLEEGFVLSNQNWNIYIKLLLQGSGVSRVKLAFEIFEDNLMPGFVGWGTQAGRKSAEPIRRRLPLSIRYQAKNIRHRRPLVSTSSALANAYLGLQEAGIESIEVRFLLKNIKQRCPRTIAHLESMPMQNHLQAMRDARVE